MAEIVLQPLYVDYSLPPGWYRNVKLTQDGPKAGKWDVQISGHGKRFRSKKELEKYIEESGTTEIVAENVDFTVWGKGRKPPETPPKQKTDIISVSASKKAAKKPAWIVGGSASAEVSNRDEGGSDHDADTCDGDSGIDSTPEKEEVVDLDVGNESVELSPKKSRYDMPIACPFCDKILSRKDKLNNHIKNQHPGGVSVSKSPLNSKKIVRETLLSRQSLAPCPYCDKILSRNDKLKDHIKTQHAGFPSPTKVKTEKTLNSKSPSETKSQKKLVLEDTPKVIKSKVKKKIDVKVILNTLEESMEMAFSSAEPVFVKFKFPTPIKRRRKNSGDSIDLDMSSVYASFAESPVVEDGHHKPPKKKLKTGDKSKGNKDTKKKKSKAKLSKISKIVKKTKSKNKKGSFSCPQCSKILSRKDKLNNHIKNKHKGTKDKNGGKENVSKAKVQNTKTDNPKKLVKAKTESKHLLNSASEQESEANSSKLLPTTVKNTNEKKMKKVDSKAKEDLKKSKPVKVKSTNSVVKKTSNIYASLHANLSLLKKSM